MKNVDPLSEKNKLIFSIGPLSGQLLPSAGKMVIASKSPLTGGYGDENIGTMASVHLKKAGYDMVVMEGKSGKPCYVLIEDENVQILDATDLWGKNSFEAQDLLQKKHGKNLGVLLIGPGGENDGSQPSCPREAGQGDGPGWARSWIKNLKPLSSRGPRVFRTLMTPN